MKTMKTNKLNRIVALAIMLGVTLFASASGVVKGQVIDENNVPVQYATATLIDVVTDRIVVGDMCDNNGDFIIENVQPGFYILSIRNVGFEKDETTEIVVVEENTMYDVPVHLKEAVCNLPELQVVSKRYTFVFPIVEVIDANS